MVLVAAVLGLVVVASLKDEKKNEQTGNQWPYNGREQYKFGMQNGFIFQPINFFLCVVYPFVQRPHFSFEEQFEP